jgi:hypothetical protein
MLKTDIVYFLPKAIDKEGMSFKVKVSDNFGKALPNFMKVDTTRMGEISIAIAPETK